MARQTLLPPGKLLRPAIFVAAAAAAGMPHMDAVPVALSVEYLHVGALIHDDIIDGDALRRGRDTVAARHGTSNAIVAGDSLIVSAFQALTGYADRVPAARLLAVVRVLAEAGIDLCRGQIMEDELQADPDWSLDRYLEMVALKTSSLFRAAGLGGVLLAGGSDAEQVAVVRYAQHLGLALQVSDDLLPYVSTTATSGKPASSDMANHRRTYPLILCHQNAGPADRDRIADALSGAHPPQEALAKVSEVLLATGALQRSRTSARQQAALAKEALGTLRAGPARDALAAVADLAVDRER